MSNIKLGVTIFSFTDKYCKGIFTLEDCIRTAKELGAEGYEIVGSQMLRSYPYVSDKSLGEIKAINSYYDIEASCYGANMDRGMRADRNLTEDEMLSRAINDLKTANKLGCKVMREQFLMSPNAMRRLAPYAEEYDVKVGIEIHNPEIPSSPIMQEYLEVFEKSGSKHIGFIPDFGCFATKPNKPHWERALSQGAPLELLEMSRDLRLQGVPMREAAEKLQKAGANGPTMAAFNGMYGFVQFSNKPDYEGLKKIMPYCFEMHGKFHYVGEDLKEASIPYEELLPIIKEAGFNGYIMSEYEQEGPYDAVEQVKRHLNMEKKILGLV
ncbi:sugar phosphate isomerase/epimerase [Clostridium intestinale]|uniref:sugar phosphate isomerase/epimerase family protein n=1 Tax=Clostridium intestinale TaxID=36845 RepID=UPI0028E67DC1|nr:sugar phosphate isomerase/epimerase [Clostridium intestinale]